MSVNSSQNSVGSPFPIQQPVKLNVEHEVVDQGSLPIIQDIGSGIKTDEALETQINQLKEKGYDPSKLIIKAFIEKENGVPVLTPYTYPDKDGQRLSGKVIYKIYTKDNEQNPISQLRGTVYTSASVDEPQGRYEALILMKTFSDAQKKLATSYAQSLNVSNEQQAAVVDETDQKIKDALSQGRLTITLEKSAQSGAILSAKIRVGKEQSIDLSKHKVRVINDKGEWDKQTENANRLFSRFERHYSRYERLQHVPVRVQGEVDYSHLLHVDPSKINSALKTNEAKEAYVKHMQKEIQTRKEELETIEDNFFDEDQVSAEWEILNNLKLLLATEEDIEGMKVNLREDKLKEVDEEVAKQVEEGFERSIRDLQKKYGLSPSMSDQARVKELEKFSPTIADLIERQQASENSISSRDLNILFYAEEYTEQDYSTLNQLADRLAKSNTEDLRKAGENLKEALGLDISPRPDSWGDLATLVHPSLDATEENPAPTLLSDKTIETLMKYEVELKNLESQRPLRLLLENSIEQDFNQYQDAFVEKLDRLLVSKKELDNLRGQLAEIEEQASLDENGAIEGELEQLQEKVEDMITRLSEYKNEVDERYDPSIPLSNSGEAAKLANDSKQVMDMSPPVMEGQKPSWGGIFNPYNWF